jgi:hypothetical protein
MYTRPLALNALLNRMYCRSEMLEPKLANLKIEHCSPNLAVARTLKLDPQCRRSNTETLLADPTRPKPHIETRDPMQPKLLRLSDDPRCKKCRTLNFMPDFANARIEMEEPTLNQSTTDNPKQLPIPDANPCIEKEEPHRLAQRIEIALPRCMKSRRLPRDPPRTKLRMDKELPNSTALKTDMPVSALCQGAS